MFWLHSIGSRLLYGLMVSILYCFAFKCSGFYLKIALFKSSWEVTIATTRCGAFTLLSSSPTCLPSYLDSNVRKGPRLVKGATWYMGPGPAHGFTTSFYQHTPLWSREANDCSHFEMRKLRLRSGKPFGRDTSHLTQPSPFLQEHC